MHSFQFTKSKISPNIVNIFYPISQNCCSPALFSPQRHFPSSLWTSCSSHMREAFTVMMRASCTPSNLTLSPMVCWLLSPSPALSSLWVLYPSSQRNSIRYHFSKAKIIESLLHFALLATSCCLPHYEMAFRSWAKWGKKEFDSYDAKQKNGTKIFSLFCFYLQISSGEAYLVYSKKIYSNSDFNQYVAALYKVVGTFLFGAAVSQSLTDLAKFTIGRPRPNFMAVCAPKVCMGYMLRINCTGKLQDVTESR